jgi:hypothetical protein
MCAASIPYEPSVAEPMSKNEENLLVPMFCEE